MLGGNHAAVRRAALPALVGALLAVPAAAGQQAVREPAADSIVRRAFDDTARRTAACRPPRRRAPRLVDGDPSAAMTSVLGVLRRPPNGEELALADRLSGHLTGASRIYRRGFRRVTAPNGVEFTIVAAARMAPDVKPVAVQRRCWRAVRALALRRMRGRPPRVRRRVRHELAALRREIVPPQPPVEGLYFSVPSGRDAVLTTGESFDPEQFRRNGRIAAISGADTSSARLDGLVPDGVAEVSFEFDATPSQPAATVTTQVRDNVFSADVPRDASRTGQVVIVWRAADGTVVNRIDQREP